MKTDLENFLFHCRGVSHARAGVLFGDLLPRRLLFLMVKTLTHRHLSGSHFEIRPRNFEITYTVGREVESLELSLSPGAWDGMISSSSDFERDLSYMSPQIGTLLAGIDRLRGESDMDAVKRELERMPESEKKQADVWAVGAIFFEILAGAPLLKYKRTAGVEQKGLGSLKSFFDKGGLDTALYALRHSRADEVPPVSAVELLGQFMNPNTKDRLLDAKHAFFNDYLLRFDTTKEGRKVELGKGSYGRVCSAVLFEQHRVAVKIIQRKFKPVEVLEREVDVYSFVQERFILSLFVI